MRGLFVVHLLACICMSAAAQTINLRIDPFDQGYGETAWAIERNADGKFIAFVSAPFHDSLYYSSVVTSILIDPNGQVLNVDRVTDPTHATYPGWNNSSAPRSDGGFVIGGGNFTFDSVGNWIQRPVLYLSDENGSFEQQIPLGPDNQEWIGRQAKQTPDGGYVICGEASMDSVQTDAFVIKTDSLGHEEWRRTYGGSNIDYSVAIDNKIGGGYFLGGEYSHSSGNSDLWVLALNDTGGVNWEKRWGGPWKEPNAHITTAADGNVLVASCMAYGPNWWIRRYLAKLDAGTGDIIWQHEYGNIAYNYPVLNVVQEVTPGGDLISASGEHYFSQYFGILLRTTSEGDSLWMRSYMYVDSIVDAGGGLFRDVIPTPDGGFVACGTALPVTQDGVAVYSQDAWVVKTDSMGCIEPGCNLITGMEAQITNLRDALRVYPNPVPRGGSLQVAIELPESFTVQGSLRLTITDALGRLVLEQQLATGARSANLPITGALAVPGLYHLHLSDASRWISGATFVVE